MKKCLNSLLSYTLSVVSGLFLVSGIAVLSAGGEPGMGGFANLGSMMDYVVDTKRKRHITGGLLISMAMLFGGLAITVMSAKEED